ncbi:MAG: diguanylate cyclase [Desulfuromonadales bacterium C00003068]|nr:MAG: diguanylate cyclase [Desulfuromonadales bacterium C00003068]
MDVFQWDKNFETGLTEVDKQHHHLVNVTNDFGVLIAQDEVDFDDLEKIFNELASYTQYHFAEEEKLMAEMAVDKRHVEYHEREHYGFLQDVMELHQEMASGDQKASEHLLNFLMSWLVYHILGSDMSLARQINAVASGKSGAEAYDADGQGGNLGTNLLLKSLNNLFHQVSERNKDLRDLNRNLEDKVAARTQELSTTNYRLQELASTDALTGLANRRQAIHSLEKLWQESENNATPLSCAMIDADGFKQINDRYGHHAGDLVLQRLAKELTYAVRTDDLVCRLGGDEFLILCPATDQQGALCLANQIHERIAALTVNAGDGEWCGSISVGVATKNSVMQQPDELIKLADRGVYAAKEAGRNCVKRVD